MNAGSGEINVIEVVQENGTPLTVTNKTVNVTVPTKVSDLQNDSGFITSWGQADWNESDNSSPSYILNKPTIPAAQVNADWNSASGVSEILNKPTLATVATTGDYGDLLNTPTIPAAQVNSDWDAVSGVAQILNKPSLATVATSGSYTDLSDKPSIPASPVQSNWNESDSSSLAYIQNKPTIPTQAQAIASGDSGYTTGDQVYQVVGDIETLLAAL